MKNFLLVITFLLVWQGMVTLSRVPVYFFPGPILVFQALWQDGALIFSEALVTLTEIVLGFSLAIVFGMWAAISFAYCKPLRLIFLPVLVFSQAIPTFAIAPLLILWLGYGLSSKIAITLLMLFFPIMTAFLDGLLAPKPALMAMASLMTPSRWQVLRHVQIPGAMPKLATGIRVAAAGAPLAAIIGEWIGANRGLGYLLLEANARLEMARVFAVLLVLVFLALSVYFATDRLLKWLIDW